MTEEHSQLYAAEFRHLSPSGINRGLRTLRRALNLAFKWQLIDRPVKVELAKGEVQRDRVLSDEELASYLKACPQPWRDCATIIAHEGMRPGEVFALQWPHVLLSDDGSATGMIQVVDGKSKAARRVLPMTPQVYALLKARHEAGGFPREGWIFPTASREGHLTIDGMAKMQHKKALEISSVTAFPPYTLRHTALTRLGEAAVETCSHWPESPDTAQSQSLRGMFIPRRKRLIASLRKRCNCRRAISKRPVRGLSKRTRALAAHPKFGGWAQN